LCLRVLIWLRSRRALALFLTLKLSKILQFITGFFGVYSIDVLRYGASLPLAKLLRDPLSLTCGLIGF